MELALLLQDKSIKSKEKTQTISALILDKKISMQEIIHLAMELKDSDKATCIESVEYATKSQAELCTEPMIDFASKMLAEKAPRLKWESARVIGNCAHLFPNKLTLAVKNLLSNAEHSGTVVRWSAAYALGEIGKIKSYQKQLAPALEALLEREEKNSIKKIYAAALKKIKINM